jgi:transcriptional regulator with XRE-family HTH domain
VDIGPALAEARSKAGLTVEDVSERTRIRRTIITDIERDDFASCGGDFYARGHIRAIAKVVGTDPVPLIKEFDGEVEPLQSIEPPAAERPEGTKAPAAGLPETTVPLAVDGLPTTPIAARLRAAGADRAARLREAGAAGYRRFPAGAVRGAGPRAQQAGAEALRRLRRLRTTDRRVSVITGMTAIALAALIVLLTLLLSGAATGSRPGVAARRPGPGPSATRPASRPTPSRPATRPSPPPAVPVTPVTALAFGPGGTSQGDDPQDAGQAIAGSTSTGWTTNWYATARFGNLQSGTGLLLDLGHDATVTTARIVLGAAAGGVLELRAGDVPVLADLRPVARSADPGGTLTLRLGQPVRARYLLIWFTLLPPDSSGTYQATIYHVSLAG